MTDAPETVRLRNASPYGDVDIPTLNTIVRDGDVLEVSDPLIAANLLASGHFVLADKKADVPDVQPEVTPPVEAPTPAAPVEAPATTTEGPAQ